MPEQVEWSHEKGSDIYVARVEGLITVVNTVPLKVGYDVFVHVTPGSPEDMVTCKKRTLTVLVALNFAEAFARFCKLEG